VRGKLTCFEETTHVGSWDSKTMTSVGGSDPFIYPRGVLNHYREMSVRRMQLIHQIQDFLDE
jgi:hypothetical protein